VQFEPALGEPVVIVGVKLSPQLSVAVAVPKAPVICPLVGFGGSVPAAVRVITGAVVLNVTLKVAEQL
jgi:hypothetical protein